MAEAIVGGALLRVAQDAIGLGGFLEFLFGVVVAGIAIGMKFERQLAVGGLKHRLLAVASDAENFVIIALSYAHCSSTYLEPRSTATFTMAGRSRRLLKL